MNSFFFDNLNNKIKSNKFQIGIIGIGYVGIQLLIHFCKKKIKTIGFDRDKVKISKLKMGNSPFSYINNEKIKPLKKDWDDILGRSLSEQLNHANVAQGIYHIVPRNPIDDTIKKIKKFLKRGQLIILESTTYPGTTREKIGKELSKFKIGEDIFLSYSPERENPGSKMPFENVTKVTSGYSRQCTILSEAVYKKIIKKVVLEVEEAEMTKLLENIYRSVNIGLVNELKMISKAFR